MKKKKERESLFMIVFDICFILILCVCILLVTMLVQKNLAPSAAGYAVGIVNVTVVMAVAVLLIFVVCVSSKQWHQIMALRKTGSESEKKE